MQVVLELYCASVPCLAVTFTNNVILRIPNRMDSQPRHQGFVRCTTEHQRSWCPPPNRVQQFAGIRSCPQAHPTAVNGFDSHVTHLKFDPLQLNLGAGPRLCRDHPPQTHCCKCTRGRGEGNFGAVLRTRQQKYRREQRGAQEALCGTVVSRSSSS